MHYNRSTLLYLLLIALIMQHTSATTLTLDTVIVKALDNNTELMSAKNAIQIARNEYKNSLNQQQPQWILSGSRITRHSEQDDTALGLSMKWNQANGDSIQSSIETGGRSYLSYTHHFLKGSGIKIHRIKQVNQSDALEHAQDMYRQTMSNIIAQTRKAYRELGFTKSERILHENMHQLVEEHWNTIKVQFKNKQTSKVAYLHEKMNFLESKQYLDELKHRENHAKLSLSELIKLPVDRFDVDIETDTPKPSSLPTAKDIWKRWQKTDPETKNMNHQLQYLQRLITLRKDELRWDASLSVSVRSNRKHDAHFAFEIPLDQRSERRALHNAIERLRIHRTRLENHLIQSNHQIQYLYENIIDLHHRLILQEEHFELAKIELEIEEIHKKHNKISIHDYHKAISQFRSTAHKVFENKTRYLNAIDDYLLFINLIPIPEGNRI